MSTFSESAKTTTVRSPAEEPGDRTGSSATPSPRLSIWQTLFASILTPSWSLGLLLAVCFVLPCYEGCNGNAIYGYHVLKEAKPTFESGYWVFLSLWPYLFGLVVAFGTIALAATGRSQWLWFGLAALILVNGVLQTIAAWIARQQIAKAIMQIESGSLFAGSAIAGISLLLLMLLWTTQRRCSNRLRAVMWLQGSLALVAAVSISVFNPLLFLAQGPLIGAKLAHAASLLLMLLAVVLWFDGERMLSPGSRAGRLQLSLKSLLALMLLAPVACAWIAGFALSEWIQGNSV